MTPGQIVDDTSFEGYTHTTAAVALGVVGTLVVFLASTPLIGVTRWTLLTSVIVGGALTTGMHLVPIARARRHHASVVDAVPAFVARVALGMRLTPTIEAGLGAADAASCPITRRTRVPGSTARARLEVALEGLGSGADRSLGLLVSAPAATDPDSLIDRAVDATMDDARDRLRTYVTDLRGPVTGIYAFGVVLPLALVGILPAAPLAGVRLPLPVLAILLDGALPVGITVAAGWLVVQRPGIRSTPRLPTDHSALGSPHRVIIASVLGGVCGVAVAASLAPWAAWVLAPAWAVAGTLLARYGPATEAVEDRLAIRDSVPDLLALLGDAMADGAPPEHALATATDLPGVAGAVASTANRRFERLGIPVSAALAGRQGPLGVLPEREAATLQALVSTAARAGPAGGRELARYAEHLDDLATLEERARTDLARVTDTLVQTATYYAPAIAGVTVALATRLQATSETLPTTGPGFALVVGGFVLAVALVLPALALTLRSGWCRVRVGVAVGRTLLVAGGCFPVVERLAGVLL